MKTLLIIDNDEETIHLLRRHIEIEGFRVLSYDNGAAGLVHVMKSPPDILLLELTLPKLSGLEVCSEIRSDPTLHSLPIIMIASRQNEPDRIRGLESGADDYVTKPFSPRELVARINMLLRRHDSKAEVAEPIFDFGDLTINTSSHRVLLLGKSVTLSPLEFRLLVFLASHPNRLYSRDHLLNAVWGAERLVTLRSIDVYIRRLREKLERPNSTRYLRTIRNAGYLFDTLPMSLSSTP